MPEQSYLMIHSNTIGSAAGTEVSEQFARAWFGPEQTQSEAAIPQSMLCAGDVADVGGSIRFAELSSERIIELYIAARFAGCREQVERLTINVAALEAANADLKSQRAKNWNEDM